MLLNIRRYQTLLTFTVLVGCSGAYVACGSDDEVKPSTPGSGGAAGGAGAPGSNGDAMSDGADDEL